MILIRRLNSRRDKFRKYKVYIDDILVDTIKNNEEKRINVKPGNHVIELRISWCKSNKLRFIINENSEIKFLCKNNVDLSHPFAATLNDKNSYLEIYEV